MNDSHTVAANVIVLLMKQLLTWSLTGVLVIFLPRYLGDEGLGKIAFATSLAGMFVALILLGVSTYLVKEVARDRDKVGSYLFNALVMRLPLSAVVFLIIALTIHALDYSAETKAVVYVGGLITIVGCLDVTTGAVLQAMENMKWLSMAEVAGKAVVTGVGILMLVTGHGVVTYALVLLLGIIVTLLVKLSYFFLRAGFTPRLDFRIWRTLLVGGFPFLITSVLSTIYSNVDTTMLRLFTTDAVVGWYGAAMQLFASLNFVPILLASAILPALSRKRSLDPGWMIRASRRSVHGIIVLALPMAVGAVLISDKIISFLGYPDVFRNSVPVLAILSASLPVAGLLVIMGAVATAADKQSEWARITAVGLVLNVVANLLVIPATQTLYGNGALGAAATCVASETLIMVLGIRLLPPGIFDGALLRGLAKSLAGASVMGVVVWSIHGTDLVVVVALGALVYGALSLLLGSVETRDLALIRDVFLKRGLTVGP